MSAIYGNHWPTGAIRGHGQLMDLVIEARKEKKAIRLYAVEQSGHLDKIYIYSKTKLYKVGQARPVEHTDHGSILFPVFEEYNFRAGKPLAERVSKSHFFIDQHVLGKYNTEFRLFSNFKAANEYSQKLKNDPDYKREVAEHHARCRSLFSSFDF